MKLYGRLNSVNVQKVVWALAEMGLHQGEDYERIDAGLEYGVNKTPEYLAMNPTGLVPTFVDGEFVLWESNAIMRYFGESHGKGTVVPNDAMARATSDKWMDWTISLWPLFRPAFLGLTRTAPEMRDIDAIRTSFDAGSKSLATFESTLAKTRYAAGSEFSLGDIAVGVPVDRWILMCNKFADLLGDRPILPSSYPYISDWYERVSARAAFKESRVAI